ncbi:MAG: hypothetical protein B7733_06470 [Myxococcales bacterium FL481]|nr:MAG: hypothetical protein B7733_06470 [Myxococcales bacterium FL481]
MTAPRCKGLCRRTRAGRVMATGFGFLFPGPGHADGLESTTRSEDDNAMTLAASPEAVPAPSGLAPERAVTIVAVRVRGREQVARSQIDAVLVAVGVEAGAVVSWPQDARVDELRARLMATGYFRQVTVGLLPHSSSPARGVLTIDLEERSSLVVEDLYAASSRFTPAHGGLALLERNFLARAVHFGGAWVWGTRPRNVPRARNQQAGRLHIEAPQLVGAAVGFTGTLFYVSASEPTRVAGSLSDPTPGLFRTLDYARLGGVLGVGVPVASALRLGVDYRFEQIDAVLPPRLDQTLPDGSVRPVDPRLIDGSSVLTSAEFSLRWDGRGQNPRLATGVRLALDVQWSSPLVGSDYEYAKVRGAAAYSFRLPWGHWLTPGLFGGQVLGQMPRYELFHPGDLNAWTPGRELGLTYSTRAPFDVLGTGVDTYALVHLFAAGNVEYTLPLFRRARTSWVESGQLYVMFGTYIVSGDTETRGERQQMGLPEMPVGVDANFGLRLDTSLGIVDLSAGNALRRLPL